MNISPVVSFQSKSPKQNNTKENPKNQNFYESYDKNINETLENMLPQFLNGDCDAVFITSRCDKKGNWQTTKISVNSVNKTEQDNSLPEKKQNIFLKLFNKNKNK